MISFDALYGHGHTVVIRGPVLLCVISLSELLEDLDIVYQCVLFWITCLLMLGQWNWWYSGIGVVVHGIALR